MTELTYTRSGDYLIPNLSLQETGMKPLGKYGRMRKKYLQEHRPVLWNSMILSETLYPHLREIDETANRRLEQMMPELMKSAGVTENLKQNAPLKWVGLMNSLKAQAEEIILNELVYPSPFAGRRLLGRRAAGCDPRHAGAYAAQEKEVSFQGVETDADFAD